MDNFDRQILELLQTNARLTMAEIADKVGLSNSACHRRVKVIEDKGFINQYVAIVNEDSLGLRSSVFVQVTLDNQRDTNLDNFEKSVSERAEIMDCYLMSGDADYLLRVLIRDAADYENFHHNFLTSLPGVQRVVSNFAIRSVLRRTAVPLSHL